MNVNSIDDLGRPEYMKVYTGSLKKNPRRGKENNFMQCLPFVDEEFLEGSLMGHGV